MDSLDIALEKAYEYISNVLIRQERIIDCETLYRGYSHIGFTPSIKKECFNNLYLEMIKAVGK